MAFSDAQLTTMRTQLGVAEDADEATILAALAEALDERADPVPANTTAAVPEGMAIVSTEVLDELRRGAQDGREARTEQRQTARDTAITAAVTSGRIAPSQREHFASLWDADSAGTATLLTQLAPGLVPLTELGHALVDEDGEADAAFEAAHTALLKKQGIAPNTKEA